MQISDEVLNMASELVRNYGMSHYKALKIALMQERNEIINNGIDSICELLENQKQSGDAPNMSELMGDPVP